MKFFQEIYRNLTSAKSKPNTQDLNEAFLRKAQQAIYDNLQREDFDVAAFCRAMAISRTQMHNKLKALTGLSTTQFIRKTRIEYACQLLQQPQKSISEVAFAVGFQHISTFNRAFKEWTGQTPGDFRSRNRKPN